MGSVIPFVLTFSLLLASLILASPEPRPLTWSNRAYGPDGPWQAVRVQFGTPGQAIDAYPGGVWESLLFSPETCSYPESGPICYAQQAGVYEPRNSSTAYQLNYRQIVNETFFGTQMLTGDGTFYFDTLTMLGTDLIPNFALPSLTTLLVTRGYRTLPNGTTYSAAVGNIALGAQASNMSFSTGSSSVNGSLLTGFLADHNVVPSSSFGLHIGSASLRISGSLWIGGYDQYRIVGPVSSQSYSQNGFPIDLLDVSIGVAVGESPFNTSSVTGLLAQGNSSLIPSLSVEVDSKEPYLYLPESTCQAIAAWLPVTYNPDLGLYLWNTQDPLYQRIIASPAYLGFTFRLNNAAVQNMTIKVPFKLLNLTLTEPLAHVPTPYFPCSLPSLPEYRLGRSFLQAAFMGVNWMTDNHGVWFLAQAPGPNIGSQPQVTRIEALDTVLQPSQQKWEDTWQGIWAPIAKNGEQPTPTLAPTSNTPAPESSGPPVGLIVGVTVGLLAVAAIAVAVFLRIKRRKRRMAQDAIVSPPNASSADEKTFQPGLIEHMRRHHLSVPRELTAEEVAAELAGHMPQPIPTEPVELHGELVHQAPRQAPTSPVELDGDEVHRSHNWGPRTVQHSRLGDNAI
ncbi:hypothetical protein BR93DRAFT_194379 [Coniochaeta sp. PMI_546]|nr:hypothetical protein BR93DRAFT_194379 [Coniochaeta sp. PMI_546]